MIAERNTDNNETNVPQNASGQNSEGFHPLTDAERADLVDNFAGMIISNVLIRAGGKQLDRAVVVDIALEIVKVLKRHGAAEKIDKGRQSLLREMWAEMQGQAE